MKIKRKKEEREAEMADGSIPSDPVYQRLLSVIRDAGPAITAFSGGVDSTLVAVVNARAHGERALAVTGVSASLASAEKSGAVDLAKSLGLRHRLVNTDELQREAYRKNSGDRCFHCKSELFERLTEMAQAEGLSTVFSGDNLDDLGGHRPGLQAAENFGVRKPLIEAGLGKDMIRALATKLQIPNAQKAASPCLASRVPVGQAVDEKTLSQIDAGEALLRELGFENFRMRHHGELARLELQPSDFEKAIELRQVLDKRLRALGFRWVSLDLRGYRSGSLSVIS